MRHSPFTVVYDACVLYPAPLRDFLMWLGLSGAFRARWSRTIHDEWKRNLLANRPDLNKDQVDRTSNLMDRAIPDGLVEGYEDMVAGLALPDPDDWHVLAVAIRCGASVIVTFNERDFPQDRLAPFGVEAQHPDEFVDNLLDLDPAAVISSAHWFKPHSCLQVIERFFRVRILATANFFLWAPNYSNEVSKPYWGSMG
jgi:predicted nucleic acid-binding protein